MYPVQSLHQSTISDQNPQFAFPLSACLREIVTAVRNNNRRNVLLHSKKAAGLLFVQNGSRSSNVNKSNDGRFLNEDIFQSFSKMRMNLIFGDVMHYFSNESIVKCDELLSILIFIFKDKDNLDSAHMVLSDLYMELSVLRQKQERFQEALEYGGRSLFIRVKLSSLLADHLRTNVTLAGVLKKSIDTKVSDSHYHLANVYRQLSDYASSIKELYLCRDLRCKIHGDDSLAVSHCDLMLGQVNASAGKRAEAYVAFFRSYRSRFNHLGAEHQQTSAAEKALIQQRHQATIQDSIPIGFSFDKSIVSGFELKSLALELKLHDFPPNSFEYCMYLLIYRIENEDVFTFQQLHFMISSAVKYAEREANPTEETDILSVEKLAHINLLTDKFLKIAYSTTSDSNPGDAGRNALDNSSVDGHIDNIGTAIAAEESRYYMETNSSPFIITGDEQNNEQSTAEEVLSLSPNIELRSIEEPKAESKVISIFHERATLSSPHSNNSIIEPLPCPTRAQGFSLRRDESSEDEREGLVSWDGKFIHVYKPMRSPNRSVASSNSDLLLSTQQSNTNISSSNGHESENMVTLTLSFAMPPKTAVGGSRLIARDSVGALVVIKRLSLGEFFAFALGKLHPHVFNEEVQDALTICDNKAPFSRKNSSTLIDFSINMIEPSRRVSFISRAVTANQSQQTPSNARRSSATFTPGAVVDKMHSPLGSSALYAGSSADLNSTGQSKSSDSYSGEAKNKRKSVSFQANSTTDRVASSSPSINYTTVNGVRRAIDIPIPPPVPSSWPPIPFTDESNSAAQSAVITPILSMPSPSALAMNNSLSGVNKLFEHITTEEGGAPKPKLKQLHLAQLQGPIDGTIWAPSKQDVHLPLDFFSNIMEEFEISTKKKAAATSKKGGDKGKSNKDGDKGQPAQPSIIDPQRSQHINIMLAKFSKRSLQSIAEAVRDLNIEELGQSLISSLAQFIPTKDETAKINKFLQASKGDNSSSNESMLGKAEEFIWTMSKIDAFELRLTIMSFYLSYKEVAQDITTKTDTLFKAIQEVRGSARLKFLLHAFLCLDNTLGRRDANNKTVGFKLEALEKLRQIKSNSGESIEQYVAHQLISSEYVDALDILSDFPSLEQAMSVRFGRLAIDLKKLEEGVRQLSQFISSEQAVSANTVSDYGADCSPNQSNNTINSTTIAVQRATSFLLEVQKQAAECTTLINDTTDDFHTLLRYLGFEDNKDAADSKDGGAGAGGSGGDPSLGPDMIFGQILSFAKSVHSASSHAQVKEKRRLKMLSS